MAANLTLIQFCHLAAQALADLGYTNIYMGQVLLKGEDVAQAKKSMKQRMHRALEIFAHRGDRVLVLGAYGCGVFRNDPAEVAQWWRELLDEGFGGCFDRVVHAVLDTSKGQNFITAFRQLEG